MDPDASGGMFCMTMDATMQHNRTNLVIRNFKATPHPAMIINTLLWAVCIQSSIVTEYQLSLTFSPVFSSDNHLLLASESNLKSGLT